MLNFVFYLNIFKILKISFWKKNCISSLALQAFRIVQTVTISKAMIKFWFKFHIQIIWYSFTRDNRFLLTLSQSLPEKQENPPASLDKSATTLVYMFYSILNSIMKGRKYSSRPLLKAIIWSPKNDKKADSLCTNFSSISNKCVINKMVN